MSCQKTVVMIHRINNSSSQNSNIASSTMCHDLIRVNQRIGNCCLRSRQEDHCDLAGSIRTKGNMVVSDRNLWKQQQGCVHEPLRTSNPDVGAVFSQAPC